MTKLDEVKADSVSVEIVAEATAIYQAILEKRVLLVPVQEDEKRGRAVQVMADCFKHGWDLNDLTRCMRFYKAMTQAVDTDKLIKEIAGVGCDKCCHTGYVPTSFDGAGCSNFVPCEGCNAK